MAIEMDAAANADERLMYVNKLRPLKPLRGQGYVATPSCCRTLAVPVPYAGWVLRWPDPGEYAAVDMSLFLMQVRSVFLISPVSITRMPRKAKTARPTGCHLQIAVIVRGGGNVGDTTLANLDFLATCR